MKPGFKITTYPLASSGADTIIVDNYKDDNKVVNYEWKSSFDFFPSMLSENTVAIFKIKSKK